MGHTSKSQERKCHYCKKNEVQTEDHIVPGSHGGRTIPQNLAPACHECNGMLSNFCPARDGDSISSVLRKKTRYVRRWRRILENTPSWRRLSKKKKWEKVKAGFRENGWIEILPDSLRREFEFYRIKRGYVKGWHRNPVWKQYKVRKRTSAQ